MIAETFTDPRPDWDNPQVIARAKRIHDRALRDGTLEPGQSTEYAHLMNQRQLLGEFTSQERFEIRSALGLCNELEPVE